MTVEELHQWRTEGRPHVLVDVREPAEHAICRIEGARLIPLGRLPGAWRDLPRDQPIVVYCKSGGRSALAVVGLRAGGFDAHNLRGGILAWAARIDQNLTRY